MNTIFLILTYLLFVAYGCPLPNKISNEISFDKVVIQQSFPYPYNGINEYLGELYVQTDRIKLAKERLDVLKNCECEEYEELKELIENN